MNDISPLSPILRHNCHFWTPFWSPFIPFPFPGVCCQIMPRFAPFSSCRRLLESAISTHPHHNTASERASVQMCCLPRRGLLFSIVSTFSFLFVFFSTGQRKLSSALAVGPRIVTSSNNVETFLSNHFRQWCESWRKVRNKKKSGAATVERVAYLRGALAPVEWRSQKMARGQGFCYSLICCCALFRREGAYCWRKLKTHNYCLSVEWKFHWNLWM